MGDVLWPLARQMVKVIVTQGPSCNLFLNGTEKDGKEGHLFLEARTTQNIS